MENIKVMKFTVSSKELSDRLKSFSSVVSNNKAYPALENLLFTLEDNLKVRASDLEVDIEVTIDVVNSEGEGSFMVDARTLIGLLHEIKDEAILVSIDKELKVETAIGEYSIPVFNADDFPTRESMPNDNFIMVGQNILLKGVNATINSIGSPELLRPTITGICIDTTDKFVMSSTNMHIMSWFETEQFSGGKTKFIIPKKVASVLKATLKAVDDSVTIHVGERSAWFAIGDYTITSTLIDGEYPNARDIVMDELPYKSIIDRAKFTSALKRIGFVSSKQTKLVKLTTGDDMLIHAVDYNFNLSGKETIKTNTEGDSIVIGFNTEMLSGVISTLEGYDVEMRYQQMNKVASFSSNGVKILLMPLLIK